MKDRLIPGEKIVGYELLDRFCPCGARADILIITKMPPDALGTTRHLAYCAEHSPISIAGEKAAWLAACSTPPGAAS